MFASFEPENFFNQTDSLILFVSSINLFMKLEKNTIKGAIYIIPIFYRAQSCYTHIFRVPIKKCLQNKILCSFDADF